MKTKKNKLVLTSTLLSVALLAAITPAHAVVDLVVTNARALLDKSQGKQAYDLLEPLEQTRAGDPDFDISLGIAANEAGEFSRAIFALERVLSVQPDNARARAEMGRALFAVGDIKGARQVFQQTKDQGVPVEVAATLDQFLRAIDKIEQAGLSSWKAFAEVGLGNDTNINSGPGVNSVAVPAFGGLVLTLNPGGVKTGASFATAAVGASGRYVIDSRWSLIGNVATNWRGNSGGNSAFNTTQSDVTAGASYIVERNDYSLVAQYSASGVGGTNVRNSTGVVGEWTYRFDGFRQITSYVQLGYLAYPLQGVRDATRNVIGSTYAHLFSNGLLAFGGLYFGAEKEKAAGVPHLGHKLSGLRLGTQKPINPSMALFATLGWEGRNFGGVDPLFLVTRQDRQTSLNLGMTWSPAKDWRITPQIALTRSSSNIVINDYDKRMISIAARREF